MNNVAGAMLPNVVIGIVRRTIQTFPAVFNRMNIRLTFSFLVLLVVSLFSTEFAYSQPNFVVEGDDTVPGSELSFGNILDGTNSEDNASLINVSTLPVTITKISCDSSEFTIDSVLDTETPISLEVGGARLIEITFTPTATATIHTFQSTLRVVSSEAGEHDIPLTAVGVPTQGIVAASTNTEQTNIPLASGTRNTFIACPSNWTGPIRMEVFNLLGSSIYSTNPVAIDGSIVLPTSLPEGMYVYRLRGSDGSQVGKFVLQ